MTYLPLVGYTILLRDLLAPLAEVALGRTLDGMARNLMVSVLVVLVSVSFQASCRRVCMCVILEGEEMVCACGVFCSQQPGSPYLRLSHILYYCMQHRCRLTEITLILRCRVKPFSSSSMPGCTCSARPAIRTIAHRTTLLCFCLARFPSADTDLSGVHA